MNCASPITGYCLLITDLEVSVEPFRHHVFVCTQEKAEGVPCCSAAGSFQILNALHRELGSQGLADDVQVSSCGCLGICDLSLIHISEPTRRTPISYAVFCLK